MGDHLEPTTSNPHPFAMGLRHWLAQMLEDLVTRLSSCFSGGRDGAHRFLREFIALRLSSGASALSWVQAQPVCCFWLCVSAPVSRGSIPIKLKAFHLGLRRAVAHTLNSGDFWGSCGGSNLYTVVVVSISIRCQSLYVCMHDLRFEEAMEDASEAEGASRQCPIVLGFSVRGLLVLTAQRCAGDRSHCKRSDGIVRRHVCAHRYPRAAG